MPALKQVMIPVNNMGAAVRFYHEALELPLKFADGERYAALDGGAVTIALVSNNENITNGAVAMAIAVPEIESAVQRAKDAGARVLQEIATGPHEKRAVLADVCGNPFVLFSKL
jgi:predicted enzyme related to lactoylglutathione lyase